MTGLDLQAPTSGRSRHGIVACWHSRPGNTNLRRGCRSSFPEARSSMSASPWMTRLSPEFIQTLRKSVEQSDVVVFTHPWVYPLAKNLLQDKLVIYDAHNFEYGLRSRLLSSSFAGRQLAANVKSVEGELARRSNDVWVCSWDDADAMSTSLRHASRAFSPCSELCRHASAAAGHRESSAPLPRTCSRMVRTARWLYSSAAATARTPKRRHSSSMQLAPVFPDMVFAIAGSVKDDYLRTHSAALPANVELLGVLTEEELYAVFAAAEYRIESGRSWLGNKPEAGAVHGGRAGDRLDARRVSEASNAPRRFAPSPSARILRQRCRCCAKIPLCAFAWAVWRAWRPSAVMTGRPSCAVPPSASTRSCVTAAAWSRRSSRSSFLLTIAKTICCALWMRSRSRLSRLRSRGRGPERSAAGDSREAIRPSWRFVAFSRSSADPRIARNRGIREARGHVVAFTDDDCIPEADWLEKAARHFDERPLAGLEGRIRSDKLGDPKWRTVSNIDFEGIGFMTANMFYRRDLLRRVGGFDERFQDFREDTDLAWRVMEFGEIPHARDVVVFHPPHPATVERESQVERAKMFRLDPLLLERHPDKYIQLIRMEGHYRYKPGFWHHFARGLRESGVHAPVAKLLQQLRVHDPEWWSQVNSAKEWSGRLLDDSRGRGCDPFPARGLHGRSCPGARNSRRRFLLSHNRTPATIRHLLSMQMDSHGEL